MALREQPYLPLYVQDFLTDEKLSNCSAESTGVYIRLMCLMHKSEQYGKILLRQKWRQTDQQIFNFAVMLARQMPYDVDTISKSLAELLEEEVISIDGDTLYQKRMVRDAKLSDTRAKSGKKGGEKSYKKALAAAKEKDVAGGFAVDFAGAKTAANTEIENEYENESEIGLKRENVDTEKNKTFDTFWEAYPRKSGGDIREACIEYMKAIDAGADPAVLIAAAKAMAARTDRETFRYLPKAEKWLRNQGWLEKPPDESEDNRTNNIFLQILDEERGNQ